MSWDLRSNRVSVARADLSFLAVFLAQPSNTRMTGASHRMKLCMYVCASTRVSQTCGNWRTISRSTLLVVCVFWASGYQAWGRVPLLLTYPAGPVVITHTSWTWEREPVTTATREANSGLQREFKDSGQPSEAEPIAQWEGPWLAYMRPQVYLQCHK